MRIEFPNSPADVRFRNLSIGAVFRPVEGANVYMKIESVVHDHQSRNAVSLVSGGLFYFPEAVACFHYEYAKVVIEKYEQSKAVLEKSK